MNKYIDYLHTLTTQPYTLPTATPPTLSVLERPVFCAIRLPDKIRYRDGKLTVRLQWSHPVYEFRGYDGNWAKIWYKHGLIYRSSENVRFANSEQVHIADKEAAVTEVKKAS